MLPTDQQSIPVLRFCREPFNVKAPSWPAGANAAMLPVEIAISDGEAVILDELGRAGFAKGWEDL